MSLSKPEGTAPMVIVGAGECGTRAALALREAGHEGPVILIGAEAGLPYERPPLSKNAMLDAGFALRPVCGAEEMARRGITYRPGTSVISIDRERQRVICADAEEIAYHRLLLGTGSRPRRLPGDAATATLRTSRDAALIRAALDRGDRLALIGGGFIGLELAAAARQRGVSVTVIEAQPRLLARNVPEPIAAVLQRRHEEAGVVFHLEARIAERTADRILLADGTDIPADLVVAGIGAEPNVELAASANLPVENGIVVDDCLRTADPLIFAAGDCCSFPNPLFDGRRMRLESWRNAQEQGALAARNMLGQAERIATVPWFWSDQYDLTLQLVGDGAGAETGVERRMGDDVLMVFALAPGGRLIAATGIGPGNAVARDIKIAERLIAARAHPDPTVLAEPAIRLKSLL